MTSTITQIAQMRMTIDKQNEIIQNLSNPPFSVADVIDVIDDYVIIRQRGNNVELVAHCDPNLEEKVTPGAVVAINAGCVIMGVLIGGKDPRVSIMELMSKPTTTYDQIGGLSKQIRDIKEVVELPLLKPQSFIKLNIEPPKAVLLYGPPGTGKTAVAKAVAAATDSTFFNMASTELVAKYIGEGAKLVRELFQLARDKAPSIIFLDEIDALCKVRTNDGTVGSDEVQRTMMQLLAELDGFNIRGNVKVIAATNRIDVIDQAILRPGRFDRLIEIPLPNEEARLDILKIHANGVPHTADLTHIARITDKFNGAQLKAVVTEAGMIAIRRDADCLTHDDFIEAVKSVSPQIAVSCDPIMCY